eukprot:3983007-Pyramimonas_sp.AAC.1
MSSGHEPAVPVPGGCRAMARAPGGGRSGRSGPPRTFTAKRCCWNASRGRTAAETSLYRGSIQK